MFCYSEINSYLFNFSLQTYRHCLVSRPLKKSIKFDALFSADFQYPSQDSPSPPESDVEDTPTSDNTTEEEIEVPASVSQTVDNSNAPEQQHMIFTQVEGQHVVYATQPEPSQVVYTTPGGDVLHPTEVKHGRTQGEQLIYTHERTQGEQLIYTSGEPVQHAQILYTSDGPAEGTPIMYTTEGGAQEGAPMVYTSLNTGEQQQSHVIYSQHPADGTQYVTQEVVQESTHGQLVEPTEGLHTVQHIGGPAVGGPVVGPHVEQNTDGPMETQVLYNIEPQQQIQYEEGYEH